MVLPTEITPISEVDVVMTTWNSNGWWFPKVLRSIALNCPVCHLIVVDRFSTDGTIEVLKSSFYRDMVKLVQSNAGLASARKLGIEQVDTDIFAFIDSDIELFSGWFNKLGPIMGRPEVGAVQGTETDIYENRQPVAADEELASIETLRLSEVLRRGLFNLVRGLTTQTLVRTKLVLDWNPNPSQGSFEDYSLTRHVLSKGFKWVRAANASSIHHRYPKKGMSVFHLIHGWYAWNGAGARATGKFPLKLMLANSFARMTGAFIRLLNREVSGEQLLLILLMEISLLEGYTFSKKYMINFR